MASRWNPNWKERLMKKDASVSALNSTRVRVFLVDSADYSDTDFDGDTFLSDAPTGCFARGGTQHDDDPSGNGRAYFDLPGQTVTLGTLSSTSTGGTFQEPTAAPGDQKEVLLFVDMGVGGTAGSPTNAPSAAPLILYLEEITVTETGADITIGWNGAGIAKL